MKVAVRVDASTWIGQGHVARCLSLARVLRSRGHEVVFIMRGMPGDATARVVATGFDVRVLPSVKAAADPAPGFRHWLGVSQERDAEETRDLLDDARPNWLVVDHYALDADWIGTVARGASVLVIDDLADRRLEADLLVDAAAGVEDDPYDGLVPVGARRLYGPPHVLLAPEYAATRDVVARRPGVPRRALVSLGSTGIDVTRLAISALRRALGPDVGIDVVLGSRSQDEQAKTLTGVDAGVSIHEALPSLAGLTLRADVAIGAGGVGAWERACLGLPSVAIEAAANQARIIHRLAQHGAVVAAGRVEEQTEADLADAVSRAVELLSVRVPGLDGRGAERIADAMLPAGVAPAVPAGLASQRIAVCSADGSWMNDHIPAIVEAWQRVGHRVEWVRRHEDLTEGDLCFLLSYDRIVPAAVRASYTRCVVVHASDLPRGRGWSPITWQVLEGADRIPVVAIEAADGVDAGPILARGEMLLDGTELIEDLRRATAAVTFELLEVVLQGHVDGTLAPEPQRGEATTWPRRRPEDSRLDPDETIAAQFDLLRTVDPTRYPAWFEHRGQRYELDIRKADR